MKKSTLLSIGLPGALLSALIILPQTDNFSNIIKAEDISTTIQNLDVKNLKDGEYNINASMMNWNTGKDSMANNAIDHNAKLIVKNGEYSVQLTFKPLTFNGFKGYLGNLKYYYGKGDKQSIKNSDFKDTTIVSNYSTSEKDEFFDTYLKNYPNRMTYPKTISFPINKAKITSENKLEVFAQVFVPVMESVSKGLGTQNVIPIFDFNTLKIVKLDKTPTNTNPETISTKYVSISVKDDTIVTTKIRKNIDTIGSIVTENGSEYLILTYYNVVGTGNKNDGIQNIKYSYGVEANSSNLLTPETKVIETNINSEYEISQAKIPTNGKKEIFIYGNFNTPSGKIVQQYGAINWKEDNSIVNKEITLNKPNLLVAKPVLKGVSIKKEGDANQPLDFSKNGINYSPYNNLTGDKYKLADHYFFNIDLAFERMNLINTKTRHITYTTDSSEPTFTSSEARLKFSNSDPYKPEFYYNATIDPIKEAPYLVPKGGNLILKAKSFNSDGSESSETVTYILPFDKQLIDSISNDVTIDGRSYKSTLSSDKKFLLNNDVKVTISNIPERILNATLDEKITALSLKNTKTFKLNITKKDNSKFIPYVKGGWDINENPIFSFKLHSFETNENTQIYIYENGTLRPVPHSYNSKKKEYTFNINADESYFVMAEKDKTLFIEEQITNLKNKIVEAKTLLSSSSKISTDTSNLEAEITSAEKTLSRKNKISNKLLLHIENIDNYSKKIKSNSSISLNYLQKNAQSFIKIIDLDILKNLLTSEKLEKLQQLKNNINNSLTNSEDLSKNLKLIEAELDNLDYKYPTQEIDFFIKKYYKPEELSMANNVFKNKGKLIFTPEKTYFDIDLKTMMFGKVHAHLLELDFFKNKIDKDKFNIHSINKYDDLNSLTGELGNFDKKLLIELDKDVKKIYDIRVPNDGMGTSRPEAKLTISSSIEYPQTSNGEALINEDKPAWNGTINGENLTNEDKHVWSGSINGKNLTNENKPTWNRSINGENLTNEDKLSENESINNENLTNKEKSFGNESINNENLTNKVKSFGNESINNENLINKNNNSNEINNKKLTKTGNTSSNHIYFDLIGLIIIGIFIKKRKNKL